MLFPYTYVPHQMDKMQEFIDFIFHEVWCKAPSSGQFGLHLFDGNADLQELMTAFYYSHAKSTDFFYSHVERIYGLFSVLNAEQINQFMQWYRGNNDLEKVCANDPTVQLARYSDIAMLHMDIADQLGSFFKELYTQSLRGSAALRTKIGEIKDHYRNFTTVNGTGKCPFCGINDTKGPHHNKREAYDHYLPKALYPFNTMNFHNLAPACHECNSSYKLSKDPAHNNAGRRKAFYPYTTVNHAIEIQVSLMQSNVTNLSVADINLQFGPAAVSQEIDTWKEVYGIEGRYKATICGSGYKYWLAQVLDEWKEDGREPADYVATLTRQAQKWPYDSCNFLKKPFLDACQQLGIL